MFSSLNSRKKLGAEGEALASRFLQKKGFTILHRNYCCRSGEIDLIASLKGELHFIEVKTRKNKRFGSPVESVHFHKKTRMIRAAHFYLMGQKEWDQAPKVFSVITIEGSLESPSIEFLRNVFELEGNYY